MSEELATIDKMGKRLGTPVFLQNEHPYGVGVETQQHRGKARDYTQWSREYFSEDAKQLLFSYATTSNTFGVGSGDAKGKIYESD